MAGAAPSRVRLSAGGTARPSNSCAAPSPSYRLPREPSTPRAQFEWLADGVVEAGGEATVWIGHPGSAAQERALAARMLAAVGVEYLRVAQQARDATALPEGRRKRALARLRRELSRIRRREYFPACERDLATAAVDAPAASLDEGMAA